MQGHQEQMHFISCTTLNGVMNLNGLLESGGPGVITGFETPWQHGLGPFHRSSESQFLPV